LPGGALPQQPDHHCQDHKAGATIVGRSFLHAVSSVVSWSCVLARCIGL
jgi:hypothetical protein